MERVDIQTERDVVLARTAVRDLAGKNGFSIMSKTRIATAVSELARNVFLHGEGGYMEMEIVNNQSRVGVHCIFKDSGPGIPNIDQAMKEGFSTTATLGHGLPGARRLVDEFEVKSDPGNGVRVEVTKWS